MLLPAPRQPRATTRFSGWRIVVLAAVTTGMTSPGQTFGVSVWIDPMMATLGLTRTEISGAYLIGTLIGATTLPRLGQVIDRRGTRFAMALMGGAFGVMLMAMAGVFGLVSLVIGFTGIRMFGQGGLTLVSQTAAAPWFDRRRGLAMGVKGAMGGAIMACIPLAIGALILPATGWRGAWLVMGVIVLAVVLPIAAWGIIDRPSDVGQQPDGRPAAGDPDGAEDGEVVDAPAVSFTRREALTTAMFWAVALAVAATAMIGTALGFHQIDLLGEQGLTPVQAAGNFVPQAVAGFTTTMAIGAMVDRLAPRWVLALSMSTLAAAMIAVPFVQPGVSAMVYGMAIGVAGSAVRVMEAATFPKLYGLANIGAIRGVVFAVSVAASAFGPLALSLGRDLMGSYVAVLNVLLVVPLAIGVFGLVAPAPRRRTSATC